MSKILVNNTEKCHHNKLRFVCISDTHGKTGFDIPAGDVLIHAGDITKKSTFNEFDKTIQWLSTLPHKVKIVTGGNHDLFLDEQFGYIEKKQEILTLMEKHKITYLEHEEYKLPESMGSLTLFVSPYAPVHLGGAFMLDDMSSIWNDIPPVDILVTHTPPYGYGDKIIRGGRHVGCQFLRDRLDQLIRPKVCVFGHIHEAHGYTFNEQGRLFINACLCDHRYRAQNESIHNHNLIYRSTKSKNLKQQTVLTLFENDNQTYLDFPWYQKQHTRPQYKPNSTLTTLDMSAKEREIHQQKAILRAKKLAFKKFAPEEYKGIRGSSLLNGEEASEFRRKVECWTRGKWVKQDEVGQIFNLKHIQDPLYSSCDNQFYKTHGATEQREATKYRWEPESDKCPLSTQIESKKWCRSLRGRNMLLVGDLVHYQYHELLLDAFRDDPTVCFGELNCKDHTICKAPKDTRLRYIRNDVLSTIRKFQNRDGGHPLANVVEWPFVTSNILSSYPVLLLGRSAMLGDDDILFTRRLIQTLKVIRETSPDALVIYKSSFIGHPFCDDAISPLLKELSDQELKRLPYGWSESKRRNAIAKAVVEAAGGLYVDLAAMIDLRPDGHVGGQDCSRYCIPGPLDATVQVLYNIFLGLLN
ncbi:hypothetical protein [Parasitella parasitica]|uniref:Calcineurin-like phosphoesterase domain-containing protein n=1 Tax=Parasitella parasitica TaxID=35722 RepID=A0A0B7NHB1_9FUNG|nr:hypothetical protein [Parasitella parasitica]